MTYRSSPTLSVQWRRHIVFKTGLLVFVVSLWIGSARAEVAAATDDLTPAQIAELVETVQKQVSETRGLPLKKPVDYSPLDRESLQVFLKKAIDEQAPPSIRSALELSLRRLGLFTKDHSIEKIFIDLFSEQVAGLYDEQTRKLYVVTTFDLKTVLAKVILAHEVCHALQDQNYDLQKWPIKEIHNDDLAYAAVSVLEGDATILMNEYLLRHLDPRQALRELPSMLLMSMAGQPQMQSAPYFLQQQMIFPYMTGQKFMMEAIRRGMRDQVLADRPLSTEQIMHPEKYFAAERDQPIRLQLDAADAKAPEGWKRRYHNVAGELGTRLFLETHFHIKAPDVAAGWGGDIYAVYGPEEGDVDESQYAFVWATRWDTPADAVEFRDAMRKVLTERLYKDAEVDEGDASAQWRLEQATACLKWKDRTVIYVDASDGELARRMSQALMESDRVAASPSRP